MFLIFYFMIIILIFFYIFLIFLKLKLKKNFQLKKLEKNYVCNKKKLFIFNEICLNVEKKKL